MDQKLVATQLQYVPHCDIINLILQFTNQQLEIKVRRRNNYSVVMKEGLNLYLKRLLLVVL
jgi:hypothetical protein